MRKTLLFSAVLSFAVSNSFAGNGRGDVYGLPNSKLLYRVDKAVQHTVQGTVSDSKGPLEGVTVHLVGSSTSTQTDSQGRYSIVAPLGSTLRFQRIGYTASERSVNSATIDLTMGQSEESINEVVVTAFGITRDKKALGYSAQTIGGTEIAQTQRQNFLNSLQGRVAGATITPTTGLPGASAQMIIRGAVSLDGDNQPLFVVDGLPISNKTFDEYTLVGQGSFNRNNDYGNRAMDINPEEIESVTILKGPEASALYGTEGASGAVVITTKRAKAGATRITYNNNFRVEKVYRFPEYQMEFGPGSSSVPGIIDENVRTYFGARYPEGTQFYNNLDEFYQPGFTQKHSITAEGGTDLLSLRTTATYDNQKGTVPNTGFDQFNVKLTGSSTISSKLKMNASFNYINSKTDKTYKGAGSPMISVMSWAITDDVANYLTEDGNRRLIGLDGTYGNELDNPYWGAYKNPNNDKNSRLIGNFGIDYTPLDWLSFAGKFGVDTYTNTGMSAYHPQSYSGQATGGIINTYAAQNLLVNGVFLTTIKKDFGKFKPVLRIGADLNDSRYEVNANRGQNFYIENYYSINNTDPTTQRVAYSDIRKRKVGLFANAELGYDVIYLSLTGRYDASSTLPTQNQGFFYPATSLSFVFSDLEYFKDIPWLSLGKLRASWGQSGKDARVAYITQTKLVAQTTTGGGFATDVTAGNRELKAEFTTAKEIGMEVAFFKNRLSFDFSYYNTKSDKQIVAPRLSYATGAVLKYINSGTVEYKGFELLAKGTPILKENFSWDISANIASTTGKILEMPANLTTMYLSDTWLFGNVRTQYYAGSSVSSFGAYAFLRNEKGDLLINPSNGMPIRSADFEELGDRAPDLTLGLTNSFTYKNFNLSFLLDFRKGGDIFNATELYLYTRGLSKLTVDREVPRIINGVLRDGLENTDNPTQNNIEVRPYITTSYYSANYAEEDFIERDINWMRLKDITLSYQLPNHLFTSSKSIKSASVFVTGTDLLLLTNYKGVDPQVNSLSAASGGIGGTGIDYGSVGMPRGFNFGFRIGF